MLFADEESMENTLDRALAEGQPDTPFVDQIDARARQYLGHAVPGLCLVVRQCQCRHGHAPTLHREQDGFQSRRKPDLAEPGSARSASHFV